MRNYSMPERDALAKIRPRNWRERRQVANILGIVTAAVLVLIALLYYKEKYRENVERNWPSALATIEDVRPTVAAQINSQRGGTMLYGMQVLVKYEASGISREKWITLQRQPETLESANLDAFRWKGKRCVAHWKSSNPDQVIADVN